MPQSYIAIAGLALAAPGLIDLWPSAEGSHTEFLISLIAVLVIGAVLFFDAALSASTRLVHQKARSTGSSRSSAFL